MSDQRPVSRVHSVHVELDAAVSRLDAGIFLDPEPAQLGLDVARLDGVSTRAIIHDEIPLSSRIAEKALAVYALGYQLGQPLAERIDASRRSALESPNTSRACRGSWLLINKTAAALGEAGGAVVSALDTVFETHRWLSRPQPQARSLESYRGEVVATIHVRPNQTLDGDEVLDIVYPASGNWPPKTSK